MQIHLENEAATQQFAEDLALSLQIGDLITLSGDLGAGKSTLARALIRALADNGRLEVPSPTFTLMQTYDETRLPLAHADIYRLEMEEEIAELGFEEFLETGIILVEWPEKAPHLFQQATLQLSLEETGIETRCLTIDATTEAEQRLKHSLAIRAFLQQNHREMAKRRFLQGDASSRCYEKLYLQPANGDSYTEILMDAPDHEIHDAAKRSYIEKSHLATTTAQFSAIAKLLYQQGFKAPQIYAENDQKTVLILEDLGNTGIINEQNQPIAKRYFACAEFLAKFHQTDWPKTAKQQNVQLPPYDDMALMTEANLLFEWYYPYKIGQKPSQDWIKTYQNIWQNIFVHLAKDEQTLVQRDFHSPNILWQQAEQGVKHIGLIDFQDAVLGSPAYDLVSLCQDARVNIPVELEQQIKQAYKMARISFDEQFDPNLLEQSYAILGAQRAVKILGIFVRLKERDHKEQYLAHLPRIEDYLLRNLANEVLSPLKDFLIKTGLITGR